MFYSRRRKACVNFGDGGISKQFKKSHLSLLNSEPEGGKLTKLQNSGNMMAL